MPAPAADRFATPRLTLVTDRMMTWFIKIGGLSIILTVFTLLVFILWQTLPLFRGPRISEEASLALPCGTGPADVLAIGLDEWGKSPFLVLRDGHVRFLGATDAGSAADPVPAALATRVSALAVLPASNELVLADPQGALTIAAVSYPVRYHDGQRSIHPAIETRLTIPAPVPALPGHPIAVAYVGTDDGAYAALIRQAGDASHLEILCLSQSSGLDGPGPISLSRRIDASHLLWGHLERLLMDERGDGLLVANREGAVFYLERHDQDFRLVQTFHPFGDGGADGLNDGSDHPLCTLAYLLGDASLVVSDRAGRPRILSLVRPAAGQSARFVVIHDLPPLPGPAQAFAASTRNRSFLIAAGDDLSLRFGTTARERWHAHLPYRPACIALSQKYERFAVLGEDGRLHRFLLDDPHPESGLTSLFSRIWYEGGSAPEWKWQSSGGADSEPKLSMMPLLFGTLKGTFYAVLFAVPLALLAAIYSAEFMHPRFKAVIKPTLELMASLPSVVLGFLAALWLAPILDERVPSLLLVAILVPASAMGFGWWWARLPMRIRSAIAPGYEFLAYLPILAIVGSAAWALGPLLEATVFTVRDPRTGLSHGSFPAWWHQVTGDSYEGHNCLVVGLMMGFAVMPLIFTIAEDALSNVPANLRSGSLALGASRWQTAFRVVIPTASAGIFSGLMIGIGRAIGETMIVVMATGNTPLMDINIFDGMRTISATIATELPEADQGGTLYRTLFFGALLLFLMTFVINTAAELLRQHLREKYKTV